MENTNIGNTDQRSPCGRRCVAWGCSNTNKDNVSLHLFPLNRPTILRLWTSFVKVRRKDWTGPSRHSVLCSAHFSAECYPMKYRIMESMGQTVKRKDLEKDAVPTIHVPVSPSCLPTMATTPDRSTPNGHKRNTVDDLESTPRRTVKKPRTAFMKRENFRVIKEFDKIMEEEQFQGHIHQQENLTDTVEKEQSSPVTFLIIEEIDHRKSEDYSYGVTHGLTNITSFEKVQRMVLAEDMIGKTEVNTPYMSNKHVHMTDGTVRIPANCILFQTKMPKFEQSIVDDFINPPNSTVEEVILKNAGVRVSLVGSINKVSNVLESPNSRRKILKVGNRAGDVEVEVKLWGLKSALAVEPSPSKNIEDEQYVQGEVIGAHFNGADSYVMLNNNIYKLDETLLKVIYPMGRFVENITINATCRGDNITAISTMTDSEEKPE